MRFILIDAGCRQVFDLQVPHKVDHDFIASRLRTDIAVPIELFDGVELWVAHEPKLTSFKFFEDGDAYLGNAILLGRSRCGDIIGLDRWVFLEMVETWIVWQPMRPMLAWQNERRPTGFEPIGPVLSPYQRLETNSREAPYVMQMYG